MFQPRVPAQLKVAIVVLFVVAFKHNIQMGPLLLGLTPPEVL